MQMLKLFLLVLTLWTNVSFSANILCIASIPTFSHNLFFRPIWKALADRGHTLTVLTTDPMDQPYDNIREIDMGFAYERKKMVYTSASTPTRYNWPLMLGQYLDMFIEVATAELDSPDVQNLLKNKTEHFDLVIAEMHISVMFGFAHRFKCPLIGISSMDIVSSQHEILGNPTHTIQYPEMSGNDVAKSLSFEERAIQLSNGIGTFIQEHIRKQIWNEMLQKYFGPDVPPVEDLLRGIYFVFFNVHPFITYRPLGPKFVPIGGGSHITPPKPLGKELQALLDNNSQGVVYFSLGTNVKDSQISPHILNSTIEAFKDLPYQFIWKLGSNIPNLPKNVKIFSWLPQQDLLRHPNMKAFIFQGGFHSKEEAIHAKIPMVGIPIMGEQRKNVDDVVARGLGVCLDKDNFSKENLKGALKKVIEDPSFKKNLEIFSQLLYDSPQPGFEKAVWHVEFALRNPQGVQLLGQHVHLPWYQYYFLDIFGVVLVILGTVIGLVWWTVLKCIKVFRSTLSKVKVS